MEQRLNKNILKRLESKQKQRCTLCDAQPEQLDGHNPIPDSFSAEKHLLGHLKRRHGICTAKPTFDMIGPLHVDVAMFNQTSKDMVCKALTG